MHTLINEFIYILHFQMVSQNSQEAPFDFDAVIKAQTDGLQSLRGYMVNGSDETINDIKRVWEKMKLLKCAICHLKGHQQAYCWLNNQVYGTARSLGAPYPEAAARWRESIKCRERVRRVHMQNEAKIAANVRTAREKAQAKLLRASKRARNMDQDF